MRDYNTEKENNKSGVKRAMTDMNTKEGKLQK